MSLPLGRSPAKVFLVGAGPGDPGLITVRGAECLARADLVLHDYLVNPLVLQHVRAEAEVVCLGHPHGGRDVSQEDVHRRMIQGAAEGRTVVRLKSGDPSVFGKGAEETEALAAAGIPYEGVPGVTAALAAAGYASIPVTHGQRCSAVALITGHERAGKPGPELDFSALAAFPGTLIFYMGVTTARQWSDALIQAGKPPDTPVAIVRRATWSAQRTIRTTLGGVAESIAGQAVRPPAVVVVGPVVSLAPEVSWFAARPLCGTSVLVTRPRDQIGDLSQQLTELGAEVLVQPAIAIGDPPDWAAVDAAMEHLDRFDWLVFSSANGVRYLLDRLWSIRGDLRRLGGVKLAAIGPGTADQLARYHLRADLVPEQYRAESLAAALGQQARGARFLLARASRGREVLAEELTAAGGRVEQVVVYTSTDVAEPDPEIARRLAAGRVHWVTVTSSAIARSLAAMFGQALRQARLASISPVTSATLRQLGYEPAAEADPYTVEGLVAAILRSR